MNHRRGQVMLALLPLLLLAAPARAMPEVASPAALSKDQSSSRASCERMCQQHPGFLQFEAGNLVCPDPCPACPSAPRCPDCHPVACPTPVCPKPVCPTPICPSLPPIPHCPTPIVNLTCPQVKWPQLSTQTSLAVAQNQYEEMLRAFLRIKLYKTKASWLEANETCFRQGGHLAIPNSKAEQCAFMGIMNLNGVDQIHVGFDDIIEEGHYMSVLGEPMDITQMGMWNRNQPSGGRTENCAVMYKSGEMHDWPCTTAKFAFMCEMPQ